MALMRKDDSQQPGAPAFNQAHTILGPESAFDGKLTFQGAVRIDGKFSGEIVTEDVLYVGESAEITAAVQVGTLILNGLVRGNVRAKRSMELHAPARLYGDIETPNIVVHSGAVFEGHCRMESTSKDRPEILAKAAPAPVAKS